MANLVLIEDDLSVAILIGDILTIKGHTVQTFSSASNFFAAIPQQCPTIVISDYQLPDISIQDLFEAIQDYYSPKTPRFIIISARSRTEVPLESLYAYKPLFVEKPFSIKDFMHLVEEICS